MIKKDLQKPNSDFNYYIKLGVSRARGAIIGSIKWFS
tara:strand:- start:369 stop:479 length:111 start_codon:yes stop_codon:yes gene_type:complete